MKSILPIVFFISLFSATLVHGQASFYQKRWSDVYRYERKYLPKSALGVADSIYVRAKREKNVPQLVKVLMYQSKFALTLQEDAERVIIKKFEREIRENNAPLRNILESVIANLYWQYFKEHRWKFYSRSRTAEKVDPDDFRTWDADAMYRETHVHFQNSLTDANAIQNADLSMISDILDEAENSKLYRPTIYDFLVHNALDFYKANDSYTTLPVGMFVLNDTSYFDDFERRRISHRDSLAPQLQALRIFQKALLFHKGGSDPTPYVNLQIERLNFIAQNGTFEDASTLHTRSLQRLRSAYKDHPVSALFDFELASILFRLGGDYEPNKKTVNQFRKHEALITCERAIAAFPQSDGAGKCRLLRENILAAKLRLKMEEFIPVATPSRMLVGYANVDSLSLFAYKVDDEFKEKFYRIPGDSQRLAEIRKLKPDASWTAGFTDLKDHQEHQTELIVPSLSQGNYLVVAFVIGAAGRSSEQTYAFQTIQVTDLVLLKTEDESLYRYQVVNRNSGKPVQGATVRLKGEGLQKDEPSFDRTFSTDEKGFFEVRRSDRRYRNVVATVVYKNDRATFGSYYLNEYDRYRNDDDDEYMARSFIFTDRSIYRPGQTVYFKGILIKDKKGKSEVVSGQYVEVVLEDVNNKDVGTLRLKTNSFGSFSGEFKLPATGLTGEYTLYADEDVEDDSRFYDNIDDFDYSETTIAVEEYKRPTFESSFKPVTETFRLNDSVTLKGTALSFSGAKIIGAKVSYHVQRTARFPNWYYWQSSRAYSSEKEIDFGETATNADGEFTIVFEAEPDEYIDKNSSPVFQYEIKADVTDVNGETRSASTIVKAGYRSMLVDIIASAEVNRKNPLNTITVNTENLNGQFVPAKGRVRIYKLKSPPVPMRSRPWEAPDLQRIREEEFRKTFPHDPYIDENDVKKMEKGKVMLDATFNTAVSKEIKFNVGRSWELGRYLIEVKTMDPSGEEITELQRFKIFDPASNVVPDNQILVFESDKPSYIVGETATIKIGSASPDMTVMITVDRKNMPAEVYIEHLSGGFKTVSIPVTESMKDGFAVYCSAVNFNAFFYEKKTLPVLDMTGKIEIETISFRDKLQPGAKQTWSFVIKGDEAAARETEIVASMYDASLDEFRPHEWSFNPVVQSFYYGSYHNYISSAESFGVIDFTVQNLHYAYYTIPRQFYDELDWFGFTITNNQRIAAAYMDRIYVAGPDTENPPKIKMLNTRTGRKGFVTGTVTDETGSPIPGVNIILKGTETGTTSDAEGNYDIHADKADVLIFSFVGYASTEVEVTRKNAINIQMQPDVAQLSEVVVIGYGTVMKKELTGAIAGVYVSSTLAGDVDFEAALQGRAAGVQITGIPGGPMNVVIRGTTSMGSGSEPLYVIDGVIVEASKIDQSDVMSIEVLKDAAATAIYGSRGANGVIVVRTRSGQKKLDEEMSKVNARKNFNETAFFYPHIRTNESGQFQFTFTTPESLTRWKLQLLGHTRDLLTTTKILNAVTQKELMVTPNPPRFMRVGDEIVFSTKIANLSGRKKDGKVALQLVNPVTGESLDNVFKNVNRNQNFTVNAKGSAEVSWRLTVPEGADAIQYRIVAKAGNVSDGEQNALPILSNRILVTETMPMYIRSGQTKTFNLDKLRTTTSTTLQHHQLTLEITSNPAWYAIQSLPYLIEYPHECAEQLFSKFYANALASHIVNSNPKIKEVFDKWASSEAMISNLEKNPALKSIVIEESPWLRDAESESEQKKRMSMLFDMNAMSSQMDLTIEKLRQMQKNEGGFPWFSGAVYPNRYITRHVATGFGHLRKLNVVSKDKRVDEIVRKAVSFLDREILIQFKNLLSRAEEIRNAAKNKQEGDQLAKAFLERMQVGREELHYLYMRSFYTDIPVDSNVSPAVEYYRTQSAKYWHEFELYSKGMIALIHYRDKNVAQAKTIIQSLKESSIISEELGMYWKENKSGWYWYESPVETQALLIEAFAEIESADQSITNVEKTRTIDELRVWLLKNKQTTSWKTTKATTEAIYALLLNGTDWLPLDKQVEVSLGGQSITPENAQPETGTGYFKKSWKKEEVTSSMSEVKLKKNDEGIAWGGLYWQYFEDLDKITPAATPLKLSKKVFLVSRTDKGELLTEVNKGAALKVGDLLRVRIELSVDRTMEFLHMKDMRASGLEPVDVLSEYKWQDGLGYYQSTRDASTNFFFDSVEKGVYVFEYDLRVNNKGNFSNGITTIQSMYAPEFSSHSEGIRISVE